MKRFGTWLLLLLLALLVGAVQPRTLAGPAAPTTQPVAGPIRPAESSSYPDTHEEPIEMPDLRGRSLEYATGIWDDDEPLPQFVVERRSSSPSAVVVQQQPAPGTLIVPEHTRIVLTL